MSAQGRRWLPVVAAGAVVLIAAGTVLAVNRGGGDPAAAPDPTPTPTPTPAPARTLAELLVRDGDMVTASGTVLAVPGQPVRFCAPVPDALIGHTGPERPPDCRLGVTLVGADAGRLADPKTYGRTRWGQAGITGRYAAGTITVTTQGPPVAVLDPPISLPERPPCPAPTGGWRPGPLDHTELDALIALVQARPTAYGEVVITYPDGPPTGPTAAPGYQDATEVAMVTTTLRPAAAERELRAHFAGNLCLQPAPRSRAGTDAVWRRISPQTAGDGNWTRYGVYQGGPVYTTGRVSVSLVVLDEAAYRWLDGAAAGTGAVDAWPWLRPAG